MKATNWMRIRPGVYRRYGALWARVEQTVTGSWAWSTAGGRGGIIGLLVQAKREADAALEIVAAARSVSGHHGTRTPAQGGTRDAEQ